MRSQSFPTQAKAKQKDRQNERTSKEKREKADEEEKEATAEKFGKVLAGILGFMGLNSLWQLYRITSATSQQNEFEKLDHVPSHRFFNEYLSKGQVASMGLRFVGDDKKEIVVTLVNGRQMIVNVDWRKFHTELAEFEEKYNIHPDQRRAGKDFQILSMKAGALPGSATPTKAGIEIRVISHRCHMTHLTLQMKCQLTCLDYSINRPGSNYLSPTRKY